MNFRISGLKAEPFTHLYGQSESYLKKHNAIRQTVECYPGYPDRISLCDIPVGETALLINHIYQPADSPYFGTHAISIREGCTRQGIYLNELPEVMRNRTLSLRAYDEKHFLQLADIVEGKGAEDLIAQFFNDPQVSYIQIHNAKRGCYSCCAERCE
ncbi:DUF1203 domain-containing protein [Pantoea anthophila]|uniref:DUF1203 domain-containing protein n=1 Tax=Pantoea anthophila TaxID=470931 RepID=UPI002DB61783|nr:DUF1203 domain-containing protein [Pantoea anthophila]MEB7538357.1 DUF1203 domain-containing protein [Pantoea anthophila]